MNDAATAVTALRRRIAGVLFLRQSLAYAAAAFVAWGVALLLAKRVGVALPQWPGLILFALVLGAAAFRTWRRVPARASVVALLDAHAHAGGLVMAREATDVGSWSTDVAAIPRVAWRGKRLSVLTACCVAFFVIAAIVPARARSTRTTLAIGADVERLQERIELLKEEQVLPAERAEAMTTTLEELERDASGDDPAKAWETLDSLDEATQRAAAEAADDAVQQAEQLTRAEVMAFGAAELAADPGAMNELAEAMKGEQELLASLPPELQKAIAEKTLTSRQLAQLEEAARAGKTALRKALRKLADGGILDPKMLRAFDKAADAGDRAALARFLKENAGKQGLGNCANAWCELAGKAGVGRGRADAPMFFGEETKHAGQFQEHALPPASAAALAETELVAVSAGAPSADDAQRSRAGALRDAQAGGGSALTPAVQPRHRGTVQRFFERKQP